MWNIENLLSEIVGKSKVSYLKLQNQTVLPNAQAFYALEDSYFLWSVEKSF